MNTLPRLNAVPLTGVLVLLGMLTGAVRAQPPTPAERAAQLKTSLATSQAALRQYEWIETTVVSLQGEEKSRQQERCYYGADGALQKVELGESPAAPRRRGLRGRIAEHKREELTDYLKRAVALVKTYVPPNPTKIQAARDAGNVSVDVLDPGKRVRLNFRDYEQAGDNLGVEVDLTTNRPLGVKVSTYLDDTEDSVTLDVRMGQLNDGTSYPADIMLHAVAKKLTVAVQNSGYRKTN